MSPLSSTTSGAAGASRSQPHVQLSQEILERLREGLATCRSTRGITPEARSGIAVASRYARNQGWTPEQFIVAVKELCYATPEITHVVTTSERDAFVGSIVTACIKEYFGPDRVD